MVAKITARPASPLLHPNSHSYILNSPGMNPWNVSIQPWIPTKAEPQVCAPPFLSTCDLTVWLWVSYGTLLDLCMINLVFSKFPEGHRWGHLAVIIRSTGAGPATTLALARVGGCQEQYSSRHHWRYIGHTGNRGHGKWHCMEQGRWWERRVNECNIRNLSGPWGKKTWKNKPQMIMNKSEKSEQWPAIQYEGIHTCWFLGWDDIMVMF